MPVTSVFTSILLDGRPERIESFCGQAPDGEPRQKCRERISAKSSWARLELESLVTISNSTGIDILSLRGSYAGAFGIPQFLPSSYLRWASNAGQADYADLFCMPDAIASVGNYLRGNGWRSGLNREQQEMVLRTYNNSRVYVDTILTIANMLAPDMRPPSLVSEVPGDAGEDDRS